MLDVDRAVALDGAGAGDEVMLEHVVGVGVGGVVELEHRGAVAQDLGGPHGHAQGIRGVEGIAAEVVDRAAIAEGGGGVDDGATPQPGDLGKRHVIARGVLVVGIGVDVGRVGGHVAVDDLVVLDGEVRVLGNPHGVQRDVDVALGRRVLPVGELAAELAVGAQLVDPRGEVVVEVDGGLPLEGDALDADVPALEQVAVTAGDRGTRRKMSSLERTTRPAISLASMLRRNSAPPPL